MIKIIIKGLIGNVFDRCKAKRLFANHRKFCGKSVTTTGWVCVIGLFFIGQTANASDLIVEIVDISLEMGELRIALCETQKAFEQRQCSLTQRVQPKIPNVLVEFSDLPKSSYAILIHQDLNENGMLDKSFFGIPEEPIGFSNNPQVKFGPPNFTDTMVSIPTNKKISISLRNE